jgi:cyclic-di-AMP phosphodiesterase PgpH
MPESSRSSQRLTPVPGRRVDTPRGALANQIPRRARVSWWLGILLAVGFAAAVTPAITAEHWLLGFAPGTIAERHEAPFTVRAPMSGNGALRVGGGLVVARGEVATRDEAAIADAIAATAPRGPVLYLAFFALTFVLAALFTHHVGRSTKGRLVRVQVVSLAVIVVLAAAVKLVLLSTAMSALVVPIALLAMVPTMVLDRIVGLATGVLAALVVSLLAPFDIGLALLLLVQTAAAGLVVAERPRRRWLAALTAGVVTTLCTAATYLLLTYLTSGHAPDLRDPLHSPWLAAAIGPAAAAVLAVPLLPIYQLLVGEITQSKLIALEDLGQPLLRRIAEKAPGSWQHSLMMANMAEIAANAIGANGRLVRVGAYYHDLGKSLQPKYFIENLEPGETSPHDLLPPEVSCDAIFAHVTEGIVAARKAGLHERVVDFMHMHHGNGVLEYFWAKCREQGNPRGLTIDDFRYPGHPPQSRETALLAICDAVEAASRTLKQPDAAAIDSLVQRIVYGKLHLGQLDESGLSMADLRRISDSLRETIRHANHGRIEYPWQKAGQDASAGAMAYTTTAPRLDSLDRKPGRDSTRQPLVPELGAELAAGKPASSSDAALAVTADVKHSAPQPTAASEAARVRAGTARNAHPVSDDPAVARAASPGEDPPAHEPEAPELRWSGSAEPHAARAGRTAPQRENPTTLPGRAPARSPSAGDPSLPRAVEPSASIAVEAAPREPAGREAATTLPGRAPGPATTVEDAGRAAAAMAAGRSEPRAADPRPAERRHPRPATAQPHGYEAAATLSEAANTVTGRLVDPRAAVPAEPPDLDSAITDPPAVRRAATAPPAGATDPAEIAAALASLVSRVAAAPFGKAGEAATVPPAGPRIPIGSDAAATQPVLPLAGVRVPARASALADREARPGEFQTLRGHADEASALQRRPPTDPPLRAAVDDASATLRRPPVDPVAAAALGTRNEDARVTTPRAIAALAASAPAPGDFEGGETEPSIPVLAVGDQLRVDLPVRPSAEPLPPPPSPPLPPHGGLAARTDAVLDGDGWGKETPIAAPTKGELRALLGRPDPTRQQPIAEIERLQRRAAALADPPRRAPHPTAEVDPDDIEAAIEVAPPARRPHPNAIATAKPRKPE